MKMKFGIIIFLVVWRLHDSLDRVLNQVIRVTWNWVCPGWDEFWLSAKGEKELEVSVLLKDGSGFTTSFSRGPIMTKLSSTCVYPLGTEYWED